MSIFNMVWGWSSGGSGYKTYTQLKAMSLSDAITELNTDAQWYYDNLNGNWHIIGIWIANNDKTTYQCWGVSPIIYWNWSWRNGEIIIVKIKTDSSGNLMIPKAWYWTWWSQNASYNWRVSYDGWSETQYSGTWSAGSITIANGLTADTEHTVVIRPNSESYLWARAFWFRNSWVQTYLTEIVYDWSFKWYWVSSTDTWNNFRRYQYSGCTILTTASQEVLPSSVTTIWANFIYYQYQNCTSLTTASQEVLSSSVTSIWNNFRRQQYQWCTSLTTASSEVLPNSVTTIWDSFRFYQYQWCTSLTTAPAEILSNSVTSIWEYFRGYQYNGCTNLTTAPSEVLSNSVTSIWANFRYWQYQWCTSLTTASQEALSNSVTSIWNNFRYWQYQDCASLVNISQEVLPSSVTSIWYNFRSYQYQNCISLTTASQEALPNTVTSIWNNFRSYQYQWCTSLTNIQWWKDLSIGWTNYRSTQFNGCTSNKTVKVLSDVWYAWQSNTLSNTYVSVVLVPSAYLSNFTWASIQPRSSITDSKFVWY